jgi:hypothetical protein
MIIVIIQKYLIQIFNTNSQLQIELEYKWIFEIEVKEMNTYNTTIKKLRESTTYNFKTIPDFLNNIDDLNNFQDDLVYLLLNHPAKIDISIIDEHPKATSYEEQMSELLKTSTDTTITT